MFYGKLVSDQWSPLPSEFSIEILIYFREPYLMQEKYRSERIIGAQK